MDGYCVSKKCVNSEYTTRRFIYYLKSVLHLSKHMFHVRLRRCSTDYGNIRSTQYVNCTKLFRHAVNKVANLSDFTRGVDLN